MFGTSWHIGRIFGIPLRIHISWFLVFALVVWSLARYYFPAVLSQSPLWEYWVLGVVAALLLFASGLVQKLPQGHPAGGPGGSGLCGPADALRRLGYGRRAGHRRRVVSPDRGLPLYRRAQYPSPSCVPGVPDGTPGGRCHDAGGGRAGGRDDPGRGGQQLLPTLRVRRFPGG